MKNFKEGVRGTTVGGTTFKPNAQLRLSLAIAKLLKVHPSDLAKAMQSSKLKPYAEELYKELGKEINAHYTAAVKTLTRK